MMQEVFIHYDTGTTAREIDASLAFHSGSNFLKSEKSRNKLHGEGDEETPNDPPERHLLEQQEIYTRESLELVKVLENFRKFERVKARQPNKRNPASSRIACTRQPSKANNSCGGETGGPDHKSSVSRTKHAENEKVLYTNINGEIQSATILKVHSGHNHNPIYDIRLHISGVQMQTDDSHLAHLPINKKSKSRSRGDNMIRQSSSRSLQSTEDKSSVLVQAARRQRVTRRQDSVTSRKGVSTRRPCLSKGRRSPSASELSRSCHKKTSPETSGSSNSTCDFGTRTSSLPKRSARVEKKYHSNGTSNAMRLKYLEREHDMRSILGSQRSLSLQSMDLQDKTQRKPLRKTKSIDHSGAVFSVRHVEHNTGSTPRQSRSISSSRNALITQQGSMKKPLLYRSKSYTAVAKRKIAPRRDNLVTGNDSVPSLNKPAVAAHDLQAASSGSQPNFDGKVAPGSFKNQRLKAFLLWKKAKSMSSLLPRQQM